MPDALSTAVASFILAHNKIGGGREENGVSWSSSYHANIPPPSFEKSVLVHKNKRLNPCLAKALVMGLGASQRPTHALAVWRRAAPSWRQEVCSQSGPQRKAFFFPLSRVGLGDPATHTDMMGSVSWQ